MKIQQYSAEHVQGEIDTAQLMLDNALMDIMMNDNETLSLEAAELFSIREHNKIVKGLHIDHSFKLGASEIFLKIQGISKALSNEIDRVYPKYMVPEGFKHNEGVFKK